MGFVGAPAWGTSGAAAPAWGVEAGKVESSGAGVPKKWGVVHNGVSWGNGNNWGTLAGAGPWGWSNSAAIGTGATPWGGDQHLQEVAQLLEQVRQ